MRRDPFLSFDEGQWICFYGARRVSAVARATSVCSVLHRLVGPSVCFVCIAAQPALLRVNSLVLARRSYA